MLKFRICGNATYIKNFDLVIEAESQDEALEQLDYQLLDLTLEEPDEIDVVFTQIVA